MEKSYYFYIVVREKRSLKVVCVELRVIIRVIKL